MRHAERLRRARLPVPRIHHAVLKLLRQREMNSVMMAAAINARPEFRELRDRWGGKVTHYQVYAAMSTLRSKKDPALCRIEPTTGFPGRRVFYRLTSGGGDEQA